MSVLRMAIGKRKRCCLLIVSFLTLTLIWSYKHLGSNERKRFTCGVQKPNIYTDDFYPVLGDNNTHVFSAYEGINKSVDQQYIRLLALTNRAGGRPNMTCLLVSENGICYRSHAQVRTIPEDHGKQYTAAFVICDVLSPLKILYVAVMTDSSWMEQASHFVTVNRDVAKSRSTFIHCLPPIQKNYDDVSQFLEFIAVNQMLGVDKFIVYNHSVSVRISGILSMLQRDGLVEVIQWQLPEIYRHKIHYFGQLLATNECLYRNRNLTKFIVNTDLDEFIIPRNTSNWTSFINPILKKEPLVASFYIRGYIFCTELASHQADFRQKINAEKYRSHTLTKTNRTVLPLPRNIRQKFIYDPKRVDIVGVHFLWSLPEQFKVVWVEPDDCALNHYRLHLVGTYRKGVPDSFTVDTYMHQFQDHIIKQLKHLWDKSTNLLKRSTKSN